MYLPNALFIVASLVITTAYARCYPTNEHKEAWSDKNDAFRTVELACKDLNKDFRPGDTRAACFQGHNGQKYEFKVSTTQDWGDHAEYVLSFEECRERFRTNVEACERGGQTKNLALQFTYVSRPAEKAVVTIVENETSLQFFFPHSLLPNRGKC
jgi:hypothetical protein